MKKICSCHRTFPWNRKLTTHFHNFSSKFALGKTGQILLNSIEFKYSIGINNIFENAFLVDNRIFKKNDTQFFGQSRPSTWEHKMGYNSTGKHRIDSGPLLIDFSLNSASDRYHLTRNKFSNFHSHLKPTKNDSFLKMRPGVYLRNTVC